MSETQRSLSYHLTKTLFSFGLQIFYSNIEVSGTKSFPKRGPVIVAIHHSNSLVDGALSTATCPRNLRGLVKDTLFNDRVNGFLAKSFDCIPVKRRCDYENDTALDNKSAFEALFKELKTGACIGICPAGKSRYQPELGNFRKGTMRIAIDFVIDCLQHNPNQSNAYIHVVPLAITYLHREMFRSSVSVTFDKPIKIDAQLLNRYGYQIDKHCQNNQDDFNFRHTISSKLTSILHSRIDNLVISSTDWHTICLSHLARQITFPLSSSPRSGGATLAKYVQITKQFSVIFNNKLDENLHGNTKIDECKYALDNYFLLLYKCGLKDIRVLQLEQNGNQKYNFLIRLKIRFIMACLFCSICLPGMVLASPVITAFRLISWRKKQLGVHNNFDEVAQEKISSIVLGCPLLGIFYALLIKKFVNKKYARLFFLCWPLLLWATVRSYEECVGNLRSFLSLLRMLLLTKQQKTQLFEGRTKCKQLLKLMIDDLNLDFQFRGKYQTSNKKIIVPFFFRCLNGRFKNDWNETLRLYDKPIDEFHLSATFPQFNQRKD